MSKDAPDSTRRSSGMHRGRGEGTSPLKAAALAGGVVMFVLVLAARGLSSGQDVGTDPKALPPPSPAAARTAAPGSATPAASTPAPIPAPTGAPAPPPKAPAPPGPAAPVRQPAAPVPPGPPGPGARSVLYGVRDGDTMWSITDWALAGRSTPARIAASWRQIWDANRKTIGPDPNLIHPGQRLRVPPLV